MTSSTSQALTPTDEKLEKLMDELVDVAIYMAKHGFDAKTLHSDEHIAARAALVEYVSARTLTEDESQSIMVWMYNSVPTDNMGAMANPEAHRSALSKLRRASMKEHPDK